MIDDIIGMAPLLAQGAITTLLITLASFPLALGCALVTGLLRRSSFRLVRGLVIIYVEVFRGTSLIVQLFYFYFVLPFLGITLTPIVTALAALALHYGAYGSEVVRATIEAVPRGQHEAAETLGMSPSLAMRRIILPQALITMIPPFGNMLIELLKATSILSLITVAELAFQGNALFQLTGQTTLIYGCILVIYFTMAYALTLAVRWHERRVSIGRDLEFTW